MENAEIHQCAICTVPIETYEVCLDCAKENDYFSYQDGPGYWMVQSR